MICLTTYLDVLLIESDGLFGTGQQILDGAVDVTEYCKVTALLQGPTEQPCVLQVIKSDAPEALEAEMYEVEVLCDDGMRRTREVQRERVLHGAQVVQFEDEVLGQQRLVAPDNPANTDVRQTELVSGRVDRDDTWDLEIPKVLGSSEGSNETPRSSVDVDGDGVTGAGLILVE